MAKLSGQQYFCQRHSFDEYGVCFECGKRLNIAELQRRIEWYEQRIPFVLAEEGFSGLEIDDILERLTPPDREISDD